MYRFLLQNKKQKVFEKYLIYAQIYLPVMDTFLMQDSMTGKS